MDRVALKLAALSAAPPFIRRAIMGRRFQHEVAVSGEAEMAFLGDWLQPGDFALDIGANFGGYSYEMARLGARVIAFEPNPAMARALAGLRIPDVDIRPCAVSDFDGEVMLHVPPGWGHVLATIRADVLGDQHFQSVAVQAVTLDNADLPVVRFIKIDVEGAEEAVLAGATQVIARDRPAILVEVEERHNPGGLKRIVSMLQARGYRGSFYRQEWRPISEFDEAIDQDCQHLQPGRYGTRRAIPYINNFLFLPTGQRT